MTWCLSAVLFTESEVFSESFQHNLTLFFWFLEKGFIHNSQTFFIFHHQLHHHIHPEQNLWVELCCRSNIYIDTFPCTRSKQRVQGIPGKEKGTKSFEVMHSFPLNLYLESYKEALGLRSRLVSVLMKWQVMKGLLIVWCNESFILLESK